MKDPYASPASQPVPGAVPILEPKSIKVFGILHLVFGIIGVLGLIWGVINLFVGDALAKMQAAGDEQLYELQKGMQEELKVPTIISLVLSVVVTSLILRAAFKLLKARKDAVQASTQYSLASIATKGIGLILALTYTIPTLNRYFDQLTEELGGGAGGSSATTVMEMTKVSTATMGVISPILMCIYPILSWVLLKKKPVTDYLAQQGK